MDDLMLAARWTAARGGGEVDCLACRVGGLGGETAECAMCVRLRLRLHVTADGGSLRPRVGA